MIGGLIVGHKKFGESILDAVRSIAGDFEHLISISNEGLSSDELAAMIRNALAELNVGEVILFVDLFGGSCWRAAKMAKSGNNRIITGVNLPMILSFLHKRESLSFDALSEVLDTDGKRGITNE